jgi:hypothetical protein
MEKLIYLLWADRDQDAGAVCRDLLARAAPRLRDEGVLRLAMALNDADASVPAPLPVPAGQTPLTAEVAFWIECVDRRGPYEAILAESGCRVDGYLVTESLYTDYGGNRWSRPRDWPDGQRSPGLLTVTLLEKPERLAYAEWIERWHGTQSPVSEAMQPRARYVRNAVARPLTAGAPPYLGIVEEAWPSEEHVRDPMLFYGAEGSEERMRSNAQRMLESVRAFLDLDRIHTVTMSEYLLAS